MSAVRRRLTVWTTIAGLAIAVATAMAQPAAPAVQINGAGATFPYPLYSTWFAEFAKARPDVQINYLSMGSGAGIQQLSEQIVFFGATDTPMNDDEFQGARGRVLHIPTVVGAVAAVYNVPGVARGLRLNGLTLANIFLGHIRNWNDPAIARLNPDTPLPPTDITVVYRQDSSGTSFILGDYLSKVSPEWRRLYGANRAPRLLVGMGVTGSEGVSALVRQTPGAIGYLELGYAARDRLAAIAMENGNGEFVEPSTAGAAAAADAALSRLPRDFRVSITNAPGSGVYPLSSFTWMLLYENHRDKPRSRLMVDFLRWALTDGQRLAAEHGFAPLPAAMVARELEVLASIRVR